MSNTKVGEGDHNSVGVPHPALAELQLLHAQLAGASNCSARCEALCEKMQQAPKALK